VLKAQFRYYAFFITLVSIVSLVTIYFVSALVGIAPADSAVSANRWNRVNIPAGGEAGGWVLAEGSDIRLLTAAADGTLYAYAAGLDYTLLKSIDGGLKWSATGKVRDAILDLAVSAQNPDIIYYSTNTSVYRSGDGGKSFLQLPALPSRGPGHLIITSLAADNGIVAAATKDPYPTQYGGLYLLD
jgi:hypothetical protein